MRQGGGEKSSRSMTRLFLILFRDVFVMSFNRHRDGNANSLSAPWRCSVADLILNARISSSVKLQLDGKSIER